MSDALNLAALGAIVSDPEMKKRLAVLQAAQAEIDDAQVKLRQMTEENQRTLQLIQAGRREIVDAEAVFDKKRSEWAAEVEGTKSAIATHDEARLRWELVRNQVDVEQAQRETRLETVRASLEEEAKGLSRRTAAITECEAALAEREAVHERRHKAMREALEIE